MADSSNYALSNGLVAHLNAKSRSPTSNVDELAKFAALGGQGAISDEEYEVQKRRLLGTPVAAITPDAGVAY